MTWDDSGDRMLKALHEQGLSANQIAARFGDRTRNAIIGRLHRKGWAKGNHYKRHLAQNLTMPLKETKTRDRPPKKVKPVPPAIPILRQLEAEMKAKIKDEPAPMPVGGVEFFELELHHCRYPITSGVPWYFCGAQKEDGYSYCETHRKICYGGPPAPRRMPLRRAA